MSPADSIRVDGFTHGFGNCTGYLDGSHEYGNTSFTVSTGTKNRYSREYPHYPPSEDSNETVAESISGRLSMLVSCDGMHCFRKSCRLPDQGSRRHYLGLVLDIHGSLHRLHNGLGDGDANSVQRKWFSAFEAPVSTFEHNERANDEKIQDQDPLDGDPRARAPRNPLRNADRDEDLYPSKRCYRAYNEHVAFGRR